MVSAAQVLHQLPEAEQAVATDYVHILHGLSKDWWVSFLMVHV
jgi:hypothetical protein